MINKRWFYITFGQSHVHRFNGITLDKDIVLAVKCFTYEQVREFTIQTFNEEWANIYEEPHLEYYHRGLIEIEI